MTSSGYLRKLIMQSEKNFKNYQDETATGEEGTGEIWTRRYKIGLLSLYLDDMSEPYLATMMNIGEVINLDSYYSDALGDPCAGCGYFSLTAATTNHDIGRERTNSSVNTNVDDRMLTEAEEVSDGRDRTFDSTDTSLQQYWDAYNATGDYYYDVVD